LLGSASQSDAYLGPAGRADDESLHRSVLGENGRNWRDRRRLSSSARASTASEMVSLNTLLRCSGHAPLRTRLD